MLKKSITIPFKYGTGEKAQTKTISESELKETYGCYSKTPEKGDSWKVILQVSCVGAGKNGDYVIDGKNIGWNIKINEIYAGPDSKEADYNYGNGLPKNQGKVIDVDINSPSQAVTEPIEKAVDAVTTFADNYKKNKIGTLLCYFFDFIKMIFGDFPQFVINMIQTAADDTLSNWQLMYTKEELTADGEDGNVNKYTQVSDYVEGQGKEWQEVIDIKKEDSSDERFDTETEIPVIIADIYNMAIGHIDFLDVNFLTTNGNHKAGSKWLILRNIAASFIHISIYLGSAILVVTLIINGIQIVLINFKNPEEEAEHKERLEKFGTSVAMLVGSVVIMSLCIYSSQAFFDSIEQTNTEELPIRVNVEAANYSFSTTPTGYIRYMAEIKDVNEYVEKGIFVVVYIALVWVNVAIIVVMLIRMIGLWALSIVGPITAVLSIFNIEGPVNFNRWVNLYVRLSLIQVLLAIVYRIVLQCAVK